MACPCCPHFLLGLRSQLSSHLFLPLRCLLAPLVLGAGRYERAFPPSVLVTFLVACSLPTRLDCPSASWILQHEDRDMQAECTVPLITVLTFELPLTLCPPVLRLHPQAQGLHRWKHRKPLSLLFSPFFPPEKSLWI